MIRTLCLVGLLSFSASAQDTVLLPLVATFGPFRMVSGQTARVCVNHFFNNSLMNSAVQNRPLDVVMLFADALNGVRLEPPKELSIALTKGACEEFRVPDSQPDSTVMILLAPRSQQDRSQFSPELLPVCSVSIFEGSRLLTMVPMVPKANLLVPRARQ
jgi:hypothetical protein